MSTQHIVRAAGVIASGAILLSMTTTPAHAGKACDLSGGIVCGRVQNLPGSATSINVYSDWVGGNTPAGASKGLTPGSNSKQLGIKDADGFCVPFGRTANVSVIGPDGNYVSHTKVTSSCFKVSDGYMAQVKVLR